MISVFAGWPNCATASPFSPTDDAQVLERLPYRPTDPTIRELRRLRTELAGDPNNSTLAARLAQRYIEQGRAEGDPRYLGYAQAAIAPWLGIPKPPSNILILRATIRQSQHDFDGALADLSLALLSDPTNPQIWLTRALILQVQGHFDEAKKSCGHLLRLSSSLVATTCVSGVGSLSGQAEKSYDLLRRSLDQADESTPDERLWVLTLLAEMAERAGKTKIAEGHFIQALRLGVRDSYLMAAYAVFCWTRTARMKLFYC